VGRVRQRCQWPAAVRSALSTTGRAARGTRGVGEEGGAAQGGVPRRAVWRTEAGLGVRAQRGRGAVDARTPAWAPLWSARVETSSARLLRPGFFSKNLNCSA
jgi:hypothetical protein